MTSAPLFFFPGGPRLIINMNRNQFEVFAVDMEAENLCTMTDSLADRVTTVFARRGQRSSQYQ